MCKIQFRIICFLQHSQMTQKDAIQIMNCQIIKTYIKQEIMAEVFGVSIYFDKNFSFKFRNDLNISCKDVESLSVKILFDNFFLMIVYFLFPLLIQQTTKHKSFLYIRKIIRKSNHQHKTEPFPNLHLAVPREHIRFKRTYFRVTL